MKNQIMTREQYLKALDGFRDRPVIKAIVGIRRCGKSTLLGMYRDRLIHTGVDEGQIVMMNFSHLPYSDMTAEEVYAEISGRGGRTYVFLDEVQEIAGWDRVVVSLLETRDCDIYVTGSNSVMFASKLTTLLSGRAVTVEMFPFSYSEFLDFTGEDDSDSALTEYIAYGGFPIALMVHGSPESEISILEDIYSTVVLKDIVQRYSIRNQQMLDRISRFLMRSIGSPVSVKSIRDYMSSSGQRVNFETVDLYLGYLEESLAFYRVKRYNIKAKEELVVNDKFYLSDPGLRTAAFGRRGTDIGYMMENLVYLELRRRGYSLHVGKIDDMEVDFVAVGSTRTVYLQVCYSIRDPETAERELRPLRAIRDGHRKMIVVMEVSVDRDHDGIEELGLREFLLDPWI